MGCAAFLSVAYGLFAYVSVTHGKERTDSREVPQVHAHACSALVSFALVFDIGNLIYIVHEFEVPYSLNFQSLYASTSVVLHAVRAGTTDSNSKT